MGRREASKSRNPKTHINIALLEENIDQVEKMLALANDFGVDKVTFERSFPWTPVPPGKGTLPLCSDQCHGPGSGLPGAVTLGTHRPLPTDEVYALCPVQRRCCTLLFTGLMYR